MQSDRRIPVFFCPYCASKNEFKRKLIVEANIFLPPGGGEGSIQRRLLGTPELSGGDDSSTSDNRSSAGDPMNCEEAVSQGQVCKSPSCLSLCAIPGKAKEDATRSSGQETPHTHRRLEQSTDVAPAWTMLGRSQEHPVNREAKWEHPV